MSISGVYADGDAINMADCEVEVDLTPATSAFANIDSWTSAIAATPETVNTTETYTFTHTGPIIFAGNPGPIDVTCTVVFTEGATDPYSNIKAQSLSALTDVRWGPAGAGSGGISFTTGGGRLVSRTLPQGAADGSTATTFDFTVRAGSVATGVIA